MDLVSVPIQRPRDQSKAKQIPIYFVIAGGTGFNQFSNYAGNSDGAKSSIQPSFSIKSSQCVSFANFSLS